MLHFVGNYKSLNCLVIESTDAFAPATKSSCLSTGNSSSNIAHQLIHIDFVNLNLKICKKNLLFHTQKISPIKPDWKCTSYAHE